MNANRDNNYVPEGLAVLNTDGVTLVPVGINGATGGMLINVTDTISFTMNPIDPRDENYVKCLTWEGTDGQVYPWVVNSMGEVLIDT